MKDNHDSSRRNGGGGEQHRKVTGKVRVQGEVEIHLPPDVKKENAAAHQKSETRETIRQWIEGITLIFVIIVAAMGGIQSCQAIKSANAAKKSADVASSALILTRAQVLPAIVVERMDIRQPLIPGQPTPIANSFKNVGGSLAFDVRSFSTYRSVIDGSGPLFEFHGITDSRATIGAGETYDTTAAIEPMTATQILQYQEGKREIYLTGMVVYTDVTNITHHRYYCFRFDPKTGNGLGCQETKKSD
jgi:hypothetical protein